MELIKILLKDRTTDKNIIFATNDYEENGKDFSFKSQITKECITGEFENLIIPRAFKSIEKQKKRVKIKAEVFTPLDIVNKMNDEVDNKNLHWQDYVKLLKLEMTCGEAPFIVSRYNPTSDDGKILPLEERVGFLDKKLSLINKECKDEEDWLKWVQEAYKASYGYEWQGDSLYIARNNLLETFKDYYREQFNKEVNIEEQKKIAEIISWNLFQMDGLKFVIPESCGTRKRKMNGKMFLLGFEEVIKEEECKGCKNKTLDHNGIFAKIKDWRLNKEIKFIDLLI